MGRIALSLLLVAGWAGVTAAQTPLSLADAMALARARHPSSRAAAASEREAGAQVAAARAGFLPRVDFLQEWQRGNQPVFVFSTLLAQRQFDAGRFAIPLLNHPDAVGNLHSALTVAQTVFDGGANRLDVRRASIGRELAVASRTRVEQDLALAAAQAYARVVELEAASVAASGAVDAAEADLTLAKDRRDAGVVTEADVLAIDVHLARMRQQLVRTKGELQVARAQLNVAVGATVDDSMTVSWPDDAPPPPTLDVMEREALEGRPEGREARLGEDLASAQSGLARAAYLPQVGVLGSYDLNGDAPAGMVTSWGLGVQVRVNLFRGFADRARVDATAAARERAAAERERVTQLLRLDVRSAAARLEAARAGLVVGRAAVAQARESQRIVRDRYEGGLATVNDIVRAADAVLQAEYLTISARVDVVLQSLALDRARGRL